MDFQLIGKMLVGIGILLVVLGLICLILAKLNFTGLPGDIVFKKGNTTFFFPIISCIVISILGTIILNLFFRK